MLANLSRLRGRKALFAAFGLGALAALALPPLHLVPVLLLAVPGLIALIDGAGSTRRAAWIGLAWGWGHHIVGLYWISHALLTDPWRWGWLVPIAVPGLALPMAAYVAVAALAAWRAGPGWRRWLTLAAAWTVLEWLRGLLFTGFPWNLMGSVWAFDALPIQAAAYVGAYGLSLITLLLAGLPVLGRRAVAGGGVALLVLGGFGWMRLAQPVPAGPPVDVLLVQGNVQQEAKWREDQRWPIFRRYLELTQQGAAAHAAPERRLAVLWPETASPFLLPVDAAAREFAGRALPPNAVLLAGSVRAEWGPDGRAARVFNSLSAVGPDGSLLGVYDKAHLVPFGEYMPLGGLLPVRVVQGGLDFSAGPGPLAMRVDGLPAFSPLICYEVIFPGAVVPPLSEARPGWIVNITNDAWFGFSAGPYQHLAAARLRAVEEGLPLARAAQTGISAIFDARGVKVVHLGLGVEGSVSTPLPAPLPATVFAKFGTILPVLSAFLMLMVVAICRKSTRSG